MTRLKNIDRVDGLDLRIGHGVGNFRVARQEGKIRFPFELGQLFRIAVSYEWERTEGLTAEDMIDVLSATYGPATLPNADVIQRAGVSRKSSGNDK